MNLVPVPRSVELGDRRVPDGPASVRIDASFPAQGYELRIDVEGIDLIGADDAGIFYGQATLDQLRLVSGGTLPAGRIRDHPDLPVRGVMLDVSRDKVPTMETLEALISRLASWKVNQVQLYCEHTFAYKDHSEVHASASPFTAAEIRSLDRFCRDRFIELVPNQNCLGHMNRWLSHDRYRSLAIQPDGFVDGFGMYRPPMTLEPTNPRALELVQGLLAELLPHFSSQRVHVGLDEAWELPRSRVADYLAWMSALRDLPELDGREMLVWGDMMSGDAALLSQVPDGVTICEWGYDDSYPFADRCATLASQGKPFWVAPGTSSWLSIVGRLTNALTTCRQAMEAAMTHGATGFLNTDWGDQGHLQQLPISDPGLLYGAAISWCLEANADLDLPAALSTHVYDDATGGVADALVILGDLYRMVTPQFPNLSTLTLHLYFPQATLGRGLTRGLTLSELDTVDAQLSRARQAVEQSAPRRDDAALLRNELTWSIDLLSLLNRDARARLEGNGELDSVPEKHRRELAVDLASLIERYRDAWMNRNRSGGLQDSVTWLENLLDAYKTGQPNPSWGGWGGGRSA